MSGGTRSGWQHGRTYIRQKAELCLQAESCSMSRFKSARGMHNGEGHAWWVLQGALVQGSPCFPPLPPAIILPHLLPPATDVVVCVGGGGSHNLCFEYRTSARFSDWCTLAYPHPHIDSTLDVFVHQQRFSGIGIGRGISYIMSTPCKLPTKSIWLSKTSTCQHQQLQRLPGASG